MISTTLSPRELNQLIEDGTVTLIDVLLPEDYACRRIFGAENACVYEMVFLDRVAECVPERDKTVVVYDDSGTTMAATTAREKLERAGYRNVKILEGGLRAWQSAGFAVECTVPEKVAAPVRDGSYTIDRELSVVEWSGRNINNRHHGRIAVSSGEIVVEGGRPRSGRIALDMTTISNLDLQDEGWRSMLLKHLKSDDFFYVDCYPEVVFELRGASLIDKSTPGTPNMEIAGVLTIKETARSICFPAIIAPQDDGALKAHAALDFDRTLWNVCYGSGKLYERLGMHLVNDMISVEMFLIAR